MLPLLACKRLLGSHAAHLSDHDIARLRDLLYALGHADYDIDRALHARSHDGSSALHASAAPDDPCLPRRAVRARLH